MNAITLEPKVKDGMPYIKARHPGGKVTACYLPLALGLDMNKPMQRRRKWAYVHHYGSVFLVRLNHYEKATELTVLGWFHHGGGLKHGIKWRVEGTSGMTEIPWNFGNPQEFYNFVPVEGQTENSRESYTADDVTVGSIGVMVVNDMLANENGETLVCPSIACAKGNTFEIVYPWTKFVDGSLRPNPKDLKSNEVDFKIEWGASKVMNGEEEVELPAFSGNYNLRRFDLLGETNIELKALDEGGKIIVDAFRDEPRTVDIAKAVVFWNSHFTKTGRFGTIWTGLENDTSGIVFSGQQVASYGDPLAGLTEAKTKAAVKPQGETKPTEPKAEVKPQGEPKPEPKPRTRKPKAESTAT